MKFRFKVQPFQTEAVEAVADYFLGQPLDTGLRYRIDPGTAQGGQPQRLQMDEGFRNPDIALPLPAVLKNLQAVQIRQNLPRLGRREVDRRLRRESRHRDGDRHRQSCRDNELLDGGSSPFPRTSAWHQSRRTSKSGLEKAFGNT
jgi:hypothetical protein